MSEEQELPLITFNSFYNLLRDERKNKKLNKFPEGFYQSVQVFFKTKKEEIKNLEDKSKKEKQQRIYQKSKEIFIELINLRSQKIANIAIKNSLFGDNTMNTDNIIEREIKVYDEISKIISKFKEI